MPGERAHIMLVQQERLFVILQQGIRHPVHNCEFRYTVAFPNLGLSGRKLVRLCARPAAPCLPASCPVPVFCGTVHLLVGCSRQSYEEER